MMVSDLGTSALLDLNIRQLTRHTYKYMSDTAIECLFYVLDN